nr:hypothetical protein CFP56_57690 [Quercus suber]
MFAAAALMSTLVAAQSVSIKQSVVEIATSSWNACSMDYGMPVMKLRTVSECLFATVRILCLMGLSSCPHVPTALNEVATPIVFWTSYVLSSISRSRLDQQYPVPNTGQVP